MECLISLAGHVLQGQYAAKQPSDTAFVYRHSTFIVDATMSLQTAIAEAYPAAVPLANAAIDKFIS